MVSPTLIDAIAKLESPVFAPSSSPAEVEGCPVASGLGLGLCATLLAPTALRWDVGATTGTTGLPACARAAGPKDTGAASDGAFAALATTAACAAAAGEGALDLPGAGTVAGGAT